MVTSLMVLRFWASQKESSRTADVLGLWQNGVVKTRGTQRQGEGIKEAEKFEAECGCEITRDMKTSQFSPSPEN